MNTEKSFCPIAAALIFALPLALVGCGGSSSRSTLPPPASIVVQPGSYDFGTVTEGNLDQVSAGRFSIRNQGESTYNISSIRLEGNDAAFFVLDLNAGQNPCGSGVVALSPGGSCTVEVDFAPGSFGNFLASLVVQSNDPVAPSISNSLRGSYAEVLAMNVTVNQVEGCPRELPAKAYVSVIDQGGFPVKGLGLAAFRLRESGNELSLDGVSTVEGSGSSLSLSIVMDYSGSIVNLPGAVENMEAAASLLVESMGANDEAEVIKYANTVRFMLDDFSSDEAELLAAIAEDPELAPGTAFYDAILAAVGSIESRTKDRKAVVVLTDGIDTRSFDTDLAAVIEAALENGIPVFPVGFGDVDSLELGQLAAETGGIFYEPAASDNLATVYQQLSDLLFNDQYVLSYMSSTSADSEAGVEVLVEFMRDGRAFGGSDTKTLRPCGSP